MVPALVLQRVPEGKAVKNRLHLDLRPDDQQAGVERLQSLGASPAPVGQAGDESWVVLADPDGNEFCVLRPLPAGEPASTVSQAAGRPMFDQAGNQPC